MNNLLFVAKDATSQNKMKTKNTKIVVFKPFCITINFQFIKFIKFKLPIY